MSDIDILKKEIKSWYPDQTFTDTKLSEIVRRLVSFFATSAQIMQEAKKTEKTSIKRKNRVLFKRNTK
ncbi:hypothetical protein HDR61_01680 [bacterium]|nr:hypothetical protein [bacterium]